MLEAIISKNYPKYLPFSLGLFFVRSIYYNMGDLAYNYMFLCAAYSQNHWTVDVNIRNLMSYRIKKKTDLVFFFKIQPRNSIFGEKLPLATNMLP